MKELIQKIKLKTAVFGGLMIATLGLFAQGNPTTPAPVPAETQTDPIWWVIIAIMAILLFVVGVLGNILVSLARVSYEKSKAGKLASVILLLLISSVAFSQDPVAAPVAAKATSTGWDWNMIMADSVLGILIFVILVLVLRIQSMLKELSPKKESKPLEIHLPKIFDVLNASVSIEKEKDILMDHNYDGIQELDNNLPPWWKYGFYFTIIFAVVYYSYYHLGGGGPSSHDEYVAELDQAKIQVDEYMKKNALNVDENTVKMGDANTIAEGKKIFSENCTPCHGQNGEGNPVGPNLTDDYWLHGGTINNVFKSIKYGWPAKGMRSWQEVFSPVQIQQLASFVKSIHGTNPANAKAPQGDLFQEGGATKSATDSTATVAK